MDTKYINGTCLKWKSTNIKGFIVFTDISYDYYGINKKYLITDLNSYIFTTKILEFTLHDHLTYCVDEKCLSSENYYFKAIKINNKYIKLIKSITYDEVLEMSVGYIQSNQIFEIFNKNEQMEYIITHKKLSFKNGRLHSFDDLPAVICTSDEKRDRSLAYGCRINYNEWYINGVLGRSNGNPSYITTSGSKIERSPVDLPISIKGTYPEWKSPDIEGFIAIDDDQKFDIGKKYFIRFDTDKLYNFVTDILTFSAKCYEKKGCLGRNDVGTKNDGVIFLPLKKYYYKATKINDISIKLTKQLTYDEALELSTGHIKFYDCYNYKFLIQLSFKNGRLHSFDDLPSVINKRNDHHVITIYKEWHIDGVLGRSDGSPAYIETHSEIETKIEF